MTQKNQHKIFSMVLIFSIAMGFMEAAVVIYLRDIYYPHGFGFPLVPISKIHSGVELMREAATIIMLISIGWLAGNTPARRFGFFLLAFATWDLIYYLALKLVLDWPSTFMEWDVLFLIPIPWFGPVLAPCIISTLMIFLSIVMLRSPDSPSLKILTTRSWFLLISGSLIILTSFVSEYIRYVANIIDTTRVQAEETLPLQELSKFIPEQFNWLLFGAGCLVIISGIINIHISVSRTSLQSQLQTS